MDYLFFDIECADGIHICSVGYVLTDEAFCVREKKDILVNPACPFKLSRAGFDPYVKLAYPQKQFYANPDFARRYETLRALLCAPDRVTLGHSVGSDLSFLEKACARYGLPPILPDVYDTQQMYARYRGVSQMCSLENIVADLGVDASQLTEHKSCDDAEMSMLVAKKLCEEKGCALPALLADSGDCLVRGKEVSLAAGVRAIKKKYALSRRVPAVCLGDADDYDVSRRLKLIETLYQRGYGYTTNPAKCRFFVRLRTDGARTQACRAAMDAGKKIKSIGTRELSDMLRVPVSDDGGTD